MMRALLAFVLLAMPAFGQLTMYLVDGTTETALAANSVLQLKAMESGDVQSIRIRVRNLGAPDAQITQFAADGAGFSLQRPVPPIAVAPGGLVNATLVFTAGAPANYSANLRMNGTTVLVLVSVNAGPQLTIGPECLGTSANTLDFGSVARGDTKACSAVLSNPGSQALTISTLSTTGAGFSVKPANVPFTLAPGQALSLRIELNATTAGQLTGTLQVQARTYALAAIVFDGPLPKPVIQFDSTAFASGQQRAFTVKLAAPAQAAASGFLNVTFQPDAAGIGDDPAVLFLETGTRQVHFSVAAGQTAVTLEGRTSLTLQTGTSAGRLRFAFSGYGPGFAEDPTVSFTVPAAPVLIDKVVTLKSPDRLDVTLTGFDNSYSMGPMTFRFYDAAGNLIGQAVSADFSTAFRSFFVDGQRGSTFRVTVTFPVKNNASVAAVEGDLTNTAGRTRIARQNF